MVTKGSTWPHAVRASASRITPPPDRGLVLGPILWLAALIVAAVVVGESSAIALGFAVTVASFVIAFLVLSWVYVARRRQEKRFVERSLTPCWRSSLSIRSCTAALWIAGGVLFRVVDERDAVDEPAGWLAGDLVLIPAYNEESVIALSVTAALASDYPEFEVIVLDDGSSDNDRAGGARGRRR